MLIVAGANLQVLALIDSRVTVLQDITSKYVTDARNVLLLSVCVSMESQINTFYSVKR